MKTLNLVEDGLIVLGIGVTISLEQIYTIFGIVLLSIQIALIVAKGIIKVVEHIKKGKVEEAVKDIEEAQSDIEKITDKKK